MKSQVFSLKSKKIYNSICIYNALLYQHKTFFKKVPKILDLL